VTYDRRRVLLDECVPQDLRHALIQFVVETVEFPGFAGLSNGALINAAEERFDIIVTTDKRFAFQQNISKRLIAVVVLDASSNRLPDLLVLVGQLCSAIAEARPGEIIVISS